MMPPERSSIGGDAALRAKSPIAFFCSQSCPGDIILKAQDWANARGPASAPVISGFHTAIERDVLRVLLRGGAPVIIVLARALTGWRTPATVNSAVAAGTARIVSPFPDTQRRTTRETAETRNRYILTLTRAAVFAHASAGGKTEALAREAVANGIELLTLSSPNNSNLIGLGAADTISG